MYRVSRPMIEETITQRLIRRTGVTGTHENACRPCVVVVDIAASNGGALSILKDFTSYVAFQDVGVDWVFLVSSDAISSSVPWVRVVRDAYPKRSWAHRLTLEILIAPRLVQRYAPNAALSLQNTIVPFIKVPQVVYVHQPLPYSSERSWSVFRKEERKVALFVPVARLFINWSVRTARRVIVQTHWMAEALARSAAIDREKILVIAPDCLLPDFIAHFDPADDERPVFFYPAGPSLYKNFEALVHACELLPKSRRQLRMILTISGKENAYTKRILTMARSLDPMFELRGPVPREEVLSILARSTLIFPSYIETFGLQLKEARLLGRPILAADTPFAHEILDGYPLVRFFPWNEPHCLATLMQEVLDGRWPLPYTIAPVESGSSQPSSWEQVVTIVMRIAKKQVDDEPEGKGRSTTI